MPQRKYKTTTEAALRAAVREHKSLAKAALAVGMNPASVYAVCAALGIKSAGKRGAKAMHQEFFAAFSRNGSIEETAKQFGFTRAAVAVSLKKAGLPSNVVALVQYLNAWSAGTQPATGSPVGAVGTGVGVDIDAIHRRQPESVA